MKTIILSYLSVFLGGGLGASLRFTIFSSLKHLFPNLIFPLSTLTVNVLGSFLIGAFAHYFDSNPQFSYSKIFWITGCLGALTTFSTFAFELFHLIKTQKWFYTFAALGLNNLFCLFAVTLAYFLMAKLAG